MNPSHPSSAKMTNKTEAKSSEDKLQIQKAVPLEIEKKIFVTSLKEAKVAKPVAKTEEIESIKNKKKTKALTKKVIRDSFPFTEKDYAILSELKKSCIVDGIPVKRGEILRAGLHVLIKLTLPEIKLVLEKIEKIPSRTAKI